MHPDMKNHVWLMHCTRWVRWIATRDLRLWDHTNKLTTCKRRQKEVIYNSQLEELEVLAWVDRVPRGNWKSTIEKQNENTPERKKWNRSCFLWNSAIQRSHNCARTFGLTILLLLLPARAPTCRRWLKMNLKSRTAACELSNTFTTSIFSTFLPAELRNNHCLIIKPYVLIMCTRLQLYCGGYW